MNHRSAAVQWPDGRPFEGFLWDHWRIGRGSDGRALYGALLDYGAGWRRRVEHQTHHFASSWALLARSGPVDHEVFEILQPDLLCGDPNGPNDASVWSGCAVETRYDDPGARSSTVYAMFYTARRLVVPRAILAVGTEMDQEVRLAVLRQERLHEAPDVPVWRVRHTGLCLQPDPDRHVTSADPGPAVIPAFRDPFVFADDAGGVYLVVATRQRDGEPYNDASLTFYAIEGPLDLATSYRLVGRYAPSNYLEMECPHVGRSGGGIVLTFSTGGHQPTPEATRAPTGELVAVDLMLDPAGGLRFEDGQLQASAPRTILGADIGLYAGWIDGDVVRGFSRSQGGLHTVESPEGLVEERGDLSEQTEIAGPLLRAAELTDATHQWDLRKAALFAKELTQEQQLALRSGSRLPEVLDADQRDLLARFYDGRI